MAIYYSKKGLFGGYKFRVIGAIDFLANTKFAGEFFKVIPNESGIYVSSIDGELSQTFESVEFNEGNHYFVCKTGGIKKAFEENQPKDLLCDTLTGNVVEIEKLTEKFVVGADTKIYFITGGTVSRTSFAEKAYKKDNKDYADKNGNHIVTVSATGTINLVSGDGKYILKNLSSDPHAEVTLSKVPLPTSKVSLIVKDSKKNVIMTENGVLFNAPKDKFLSIMTHGEDFYISLFDYAKRSSKVSFYDSISGKTHEVEVVGIVYGFERKNGEEFELFFSTEEGDKSQSFSLKSNEKDDETLSKASSKTQDEKQEKKPAKAKLEDSKQLDK